jgi:mono/diheme cytochrome c family protein
LQDQQTDLQTERAALLAELEPETVEAVATDEAVATEEIVPLTDERRAEIETRLAEIDALLAPEAQLTQDIVAAQADYDAYLASIQTAIDNGYIDTQPSRLAQANWTGTLDAYIYTTLVHGRGQNAALWGGNIMAAWANTAGGPLRSDQIQDLVTYILNWDKGDDWTLEDLLAVNQFAQVPGGGGGRPEPTGDPAGTNVEAVTQAVAQLTGDPARGDLLYHNREWSQIAERLGCSGCHEGAVNGPATEGTWDRVVTERLTLPQFAGYTPEQYLIESILVPSAYVVPPYADGVMPANFGQRTSNQDLADIIAYLRTTSADYVPPADSGEAMATEEAAATEESAMP